MAASLIQCLWLLFTISLCVFLQHFNNWKNGSHLTKIWMLWNFVSPVCSLLFEQPVRFYYAQPHELEAKCHISVDTGNILFRTFVFMVLSIHLWLLQIIAYMRHCRIIEEFLAPGQKPFQIFVAWPQHETKKRRPFLLFWAFFLFSHVFLHQTFVHRSPLF